MSRSNFAAKLARSALKRLPRAYEIVGDLYHWAIFIKEFLFIKIAKPNVIFHFPRKLAESSSQYGQEMVLIERGLIPSQSGFFLEVGANHPRKNSNSHHLEKHRGYSGIAIDGLDYSEDWRTERSNTKFINAVISNDEGTILYSKVSGPEGWEDQLSGPAATLELGGKPFQVRNYEIACAPLRAILKNVSRSIDVMFVDVEGHEAEVLGSNDWSTNRPGVLVVENFGSLRKQRKLRQLVESFGYKLRHRIWISDDVFVDVLR